MNERGVFQRQVSALLNRHGWSKKWPDLPFPHGEGSEARPQAGVFDNIFDRPLLLEGEWWSVDAVVECKTDRGTLRFDFSEINPNQRRWVSWREENNNGLSAWLALAMGSRRNHREFPVRAWMIGWDFWLGAEAAIRTERESLHYTQAVDLFQEFELARTKGADGWGWEFPPNHPFAVKFRIVPLLGEHERPTQST